MPNARTKYHRIRFPDKDYWRRTFCGLSIARLRAENVLEQDAWERLEPQRQCGSCAACIASQNERRRAREEQRAREFTE